MAVRIIFSNSGSNDLDNKDDVASGDDLDGKKIDNEEVRLTEGSIRGV